MKQNNKTIVLDINGQILSETARNGKVRHLLKDKQAKIVSKDPFTIQLLYDIKTDILEDSKMQNVIISNKTYIPVEFDKSNTTKLSYSDFIYHLQSNTEIDGKNIFIDMSCLLEDDILYIRDMCNQLGLTLNFIIYNPSDYVQTNEISIVTSKRRNVPLYANEHSLDISLNKDITLFLGNTLVIGNDGSGKTTLLKNIATQMYEKHVDVTYISDIDIGTIPEIPIVVATNIELCSRLINDFYLEVIERHTTMTSEGVDKYYKSRQNYKSKLFIIDGIDYYMTLNKPDFIESIKNKLDSIARLGRNTGINFVLSSSSMDNIPKSLLNLSINRIAVGNVSQEIFQELFGVNKTLDLYTGLGIYQTSSKDLKVFDINDVSNY